MFHQIQSKPIPDLWDIIQSAMSAIPTGKNIWVDADLGNDATGQPYNFNKPFQTQEAASAAASAGDLIIVRPGNYSPLVNIAKEGVSFYYMPGSHTLYAPNNATHALFDLATITNFFVYGHGDFTVAPTGTFTANGILFSTTANYFDAKNWIFQAHSITGSTATLVPDFFAQANGGLTARLDVETFFSGALTFKVESYGICRLGMLKNASKNLDSFIFGQSEIGVVNMNNNGGGFPVWLQVAESCKVGDVISGRFQVNHAALSVKNGQASPCIVQILSGANNSIDGHFISDVTGGAFVPAVEIKGGANISITGLLDTGGVLGTFPLLVSDGASTEIALIGAYLNQLDAGQPDSLGCINGSTPHILFCGSGANKPFDPAAIVTQPAFP